MHQIHPKYLIHLFVNEYTHLYVNCFITFIGCGLNFYDIVVRYYQFYSFIIFNKIINNKMCYMYMYL